MADDLLAIPIQEDDQTISASGADLDLGHIRSPDMVGIRGLRLGTRNLYFRLVSIDFSH